MSPESPPVSPEVRHRREVRRAIILPAAGVLAAMLLLLAVAVITLSPVQFSLLADLMLIVFMLVPAVLTCLIPTIILMAMAIGLWRLNTMAAPPLARGRSTVVRLLANIQHRVPQIAQPLVGLGSRMAYLERLLAGLPESTASPDEENAHGN